MQDSITHNLQPFHSSLFLFVSQSLVLNPFMVTTKESELGVYSKEICFELNNNSDKKHYIPVEMDLRIPENYLQVHFKV